MINVENSSETLLALVSETNFIRNLGFSLLIIFTVLFSLIWPKWQALQWLIQAGLLWLLVIKVISQQLELNRPSQKQPYL